MIKPITICFIIFIQSFGYAELHKNVNGKRIRLTQQEEMQTRAKWALEDEKRILESVGRNISNDINKYVGNRNDQLDMMLKMMAYAKSKGFDWGEHSWMLDKRQQIIDKYTIQEPITKEVIQ